jgi:hypothetical protein
MKRLIQVAPTVRSGRGDQVTPGRPAGGHRSGTNRHRSYHPGRQRHPGDRSGPSRHRTSHRSGRHRRNRRSYHPEPSGCCPRNRRSYHPERTGCCHRTSCPGCRHQATRRHPERRPRHPWSGPRWSARRTFLPRRPSSTSCPSSSCSPWSGAWHAWRHSRGCLRESSQHRRNRPAQHRSRRVRRSAGRRRQSLRNDVGSSVKFTPSSWRQDTCRDVNVDPGLTNIRQFMNRAHVNDGYPVIARGNPSPA